MHHPLRLVLIAGLALGGCVLEEGPELGSLDQEVIGGVDEPNYHYPWVVRVSSALTCSGVLIDPSWVLTAGHCVTTLTTPTVEYWRTDPYTGVVHSQERTGKADGNHGVHIHPGCCTNLFDDMALIELSQPFVLDRYIQTIALPTGTPAVGSVGTVAGLIRHDGTLPSGYSAVARAPRVSGTVCAAGTGELCYQADDVALCGTDSGSGVTSNVGATLTLNGRATVHAVASAVNDSSCEADDLGQNLRAEDVWARRSFITSTIGKSLASLAGDARAHWDGQPSRGLITLRCQSSPYGLTTRTTTSPMNVRGAEARLDCPSLNRMRVTCSLGGDSTAEITGFKVTTTNLSNGTVTTQSHAFSPSSATYTSPYDLNGNIVRDVACKVGPVNTLD